ncbi:DUF4229 domain-containing protein [Nostocoides sp. F2B08]|uniref:DUF4229 domain-containing protein n=1 Tax=Nostocoides sp. F2B08 TaxID=2653936 RepID=UPI001262BA77|nr:DUF4229 domain-containing protein [Tetrasphaera sp. F2B08]KAB7746445.1 DUF4229 domain-containing protein [Tetrasphaera sp. F2B08]
MIQYTLLRLLVFGACLYVFWLLGLRSETELPYLVIAAALTSMVISYFTLRPMRERFSAQMAHRIEERTAAKAARRQDEPGDEDAEDAEVDDSFR